MFTSIIFLAIFSAINGVNAKVMQRASNELYFLPLILAKCMDCFREANSRTKLELPAQEKSLNLALLYAAHILTVDQLCSKQTSCIKRDSKNPTINCVFIQQICT